MKDNHIPASVRLNQRICKMEYRLDTCWQRGKGRFYQFCRHCDQDVVSVNMYGHRKGCPLRGMQKQIDHYKLILKYEHPAPSPLDTSHTQRVLNG